MKSVTVVIVVVLNLIATAIAQQPDQQRESADGALFPPVEPERRLAIKLPVIRDALGSAPEAVSRRMFNTKNSSDMLERMDLIPPSTTWWSSRMYGADAAGFDLTDGRITRVELIYRNDDDRRLHRVLRQLDQAARAEPDESRVAGKTLLADEPARVYTWRDGTKVIFKVHRLDWWLLHHDIAPSKAKALKFGKLVTGIPVEAARLVMGPPDNESGDLMTWRIVYAQPAVWRDGRMVIPERRIDQTIVADIEDGTIIHVRGQSVSSPPSP